MIGGNFLDSFYFYYLGLFILSFALFKGYKIAYIVEQGFLVAQPVNKGGKLIFKLGRFI